MINNVKSKKLTINTINHSKLIGRKALRIVAKIFRYLLLISLSFVVIYPLLYMLSNAFKPAIQTYDPAVIWIPKSFTLENITDAIFILDMGTATVNTVLSGVVAAILQVPVCLFIGYGFARFKFRGNKVLFVLVVLTMIVPTQTISTSLYSTFRYFDPFWIITLINSIFGTDIPTMNLINTYWVFWLPTLLGMGLRSGIYIFIYRQFFQGMPYELEEAAEIDGCSPMGTFLRIMVPNAGTAMLTVFLFALVWNWNDYYTPALYMKANPTLATALSMFQKNLENLSTVGGNNNTPEVIATRMQAASLLVIAPLLVLYAFTQKFFIESVERTGLTGM